MLVRQGEPIHRVTLIMELIEQDGVNFSLVRLFYFDEENKMVFKTERNYLLGEVLQVLYEHDVELERAGFKETDFESPEEAGIIGVGNSRIWRHRWFYELTESAKSKTVSN